MVKPKQFVRPAKKQKLKASLETADDFQEAADREEEAGGKHRAGDAAKSGRAFVRALDLYDQGLRKHPNNFDLAYNKARLQLEITQQPALVDHIGLSTSDLLKETLQSHRYALKLNEENPDVLFNTSQVLTSLAEQLSEAGRSFEAVPLLQESLELLSGCLSRQEMLYEQQKLDFEDVEEGGIELDPGEKLADFSESDPAEESALVQTPITPNDLLDTVRASLSTLTTLVPLSEQYGLQTYGDMAHALTDQKAASYISLLTARQQDTARFSVALDRAIFIAAFADAQYSFYMIELETYLERLRAFDIPEKEQSAQALCAEAEARSEIAQSGIDRFDGSPDLPADVCWQQLSLAQELYSKATKLESEDAKERKADVYESKGGVELLRHRLASLADTSLSNGVKQSAQTLIQNAQTYFKGAAQLARASGNAELEVTAKQRWLIATDIGSLLYGVEPKQPLPFEGNTGTAREELLQALEECVEEGLIAMTLGEQIARRIQQ